jgi:hypothetical protein
MMSESFVAWLREIRRGRSALSPPAALYMVGGITFVVSLAFLSSFYDRYALGFLPFVILFMVRGSATWGRIAWGYSIAALVLLAAFSLALQADAVDHDNARWEAGNWLALRAPYPIHVGYDWDNWMGGYRRAVYEVTDIHIQDYRTERRFPYLSRLSGFTTRYVLAESRKDTPELKEPPRSP